MCGIRVYGKLQRPYKQGEFLSLFCLLARPLFLSLSAAFSLSLNSLVASAISPKLNSWTKWAIDKTERISICKSRIENDSGIEQWTKLIGKSMLYAYMLKHCLYMVRINVVGRHHFICCRIIDTHKCMLLALSIRCYR